MKPDWDKLTAEFKDSKTSLVADVDCTDAGKALCEKIGVNGYPTLKYGKPDDLKPYEGGRDFEALKKFADENLGPTCGPENVELCDAEGKKWITKFLKWDVDELDVRIEEASAKTSRISAENDKKVSKFQTAIQNLRSKVEYENKKKDDKVDEETKKLGVQLMNLVAAKKKQSMGTTTTTTQSPVDEAKDEGKDEL